MPLITLVALHSLQIRYYPFCELVPKRAMYILDEVLLILCTGAKLCWPEVFTSAAWHCILFINSMILVSYNTRNSRFSFINYFYSRIPPRMYDACMFLAPSA